MVDPHATDVAALVPSEARPRADDSLHLCERREESPGGAEVGGLLLLQENGMSTTTAREWNVIINKNQNCNYYCYRLLLLPRKGDSK